MFRKSGTKHSIRGRFGELGEVFKKVFFDFKLIIKDKVVGVGPHRPREA
jgi:hypothetical protein